MLSFPEAPLPQNRSIRIGILDSGLIVNDCHLVSDRRAGFNPVAIASRHPDNAARVAAPARYRQTLPHVPCLTR